MKRHALRIVTSLVTSVLLLVTSIVAAAFAWKPERGFGPVPCDRNGVHGYAYIEPEHVLWSGELFNFPVGSSDGPGGSRPRVIGQEDSPKVLLATTTRAFGWPARALEYHSDNYWLAVEGTSNRGASQTEVHDAIALKSPWLSTSTNVPVGVRPSAALLDVFCYAVVLYAAATAFSIMRGVRRRRKGRCPMCNHDRAGLTPTAPCPECGRAPASA